MLVNLSVIMLCDVTVRRQYNNWWKHRSGMNAPVHLVEEEACFDVLAMFRETVP